MRKQTRETFETSVRQGFGHWQEGTHAFLGEAIYQYDDKVRLTIYEHGFEYGTDNGLAVRYDEIDRLELLSLRELMLSSKTPNEPVQFSVICNKQQHTLEVPLYLYTVWSAALNAIVT